MKQVLLVVMAFLLFSCKTLPDGSVLTPDNIGAYPENYKMLVKEQVMNVFIDPYSIRNASITTPSPGALSGNRYGWFVCLKANSKNRMGGYTGLKKTLFIIRQNIVVDIISRGGEYVCRNFAYYEPWSEIEGLGR